MTKDIKNNTNLRKKAENILQSIEEDKENLQDIKKLINELQVYQIELELQNEELRRVQNELEESRNKYADLFDFSPVGYFTFDSEGLIIDVNLTGAAMLGLERKFLKKLPLVTFISPEYQETFYLHRKAVLENRDKQVCELLIRRKEGGTFCARIESIPAGTQDGKFDYIRTAVIDISNLKELEKKLSAEQERLLVTLESIGDGIVTTDTDGNIISVNKTAKEITGWSTEEVYQKHISSFFLMVNENAGGKAADPIKMILSDNKPRKIYHNIIFRDKNKLEKILDIVGAPIRDNRNTPIGVVLAFQDVTERNKLEREIQKIKNLESIGLLAGGIAHDFRNILTSATSRLSLARLQASPDQPVYSYIIEAEKACERAKDITNQLLTFSRGGAPIKEISSVEEIIRDTVEFTLHGGKVSYEFDICPDHGFVEVDKGQISQVINNIVINAVQAMPQGGNIKIACENELIEDNDDRLVSDLSLVPGQYIRISVRDSGPGIPETLLPKIFDPYFTSKKDGNGLGLTTSYSIIKKHGGTITVDSEPGVGTTFNIYLPAKNSENPGVNKEVKKEIRPGTGKILIMDDEPTVLESFEDMLMFLGYSYECTRDGKQALKIYREALEKGEKFDVVMLDLTVKGKMGGKETIIELQKVDPGVKAVVASGYSDDPIMSEYKEYGFRGCILKPFDIEELSRVIEKVIAEN
jgi:two-component system cell cycle sensor histidine kinase/response regulator CckA